MNYFLKSILSATLLLSGVAADAVSWYQVEVIVFDYLKPELDGELWFENPELPPRDNAVELIFAQPDVTSNITDAVQRPVIFATPDWRAYRVYDEDVHRSILTVLSFFKHRAN